jgi:hypothetical protein
MEKKTVPKLRTAKRDCEGEYIGAFQHAIEAARTKLTG